MSAAIVYATLTVFATISWIYMNWPFISILIDSVWEMIV